MSDLKEDMKAAINTLADPNYDNGYKSIEEVFDVITARAKEKAAKPAAFWGVLYYFPRALKEVAKVSKFGTEKHGVALRDRGFLDPKYPIEGYDDAVIRHSMDFAIDGKFNPADGNMRHRAQRAWNALAALEKELIEEENERAS